MDFVDCSKVIVKKINDIKGLGAFANCDINKGDLIERGVVRRIDTDGNKNRYVFSWSENRTIWAFGSGCSTFYNTSLNPNCNFVRNYESDTFKIYALQDIKKGDELTHKYKSLYWRECFKGLHNI